MIEETTILMMRSETLHRLNGVPRVIPNPRRYRTKRMNSLFGSVNSLFRRNKIRCSVQNRESSAAPWNCSANGRQHRAESVKMAGDFENSLLFSLDCTQCVRPKNGEQVNQHIQQKYAGVKE